MNNNIDLTEILKDCKEGTKLYCTLLGEVEFVCIEDDCKVTQIVVCDKYTDEYKFTKEGKYYNVEDGECLLFPSKDQRDWSKFTAPWHNKENNKEKFDPNMLKPFDKVLVRDYDSDFWRCSFYSHKRRKEKITPYRYATTAKSYAFCIPYNDDTKHLVGTNKEASEYYKYWEK